MDETNGRPLARAPVTQVGETMAASVPRSGTTDVKPIVWMRLVRDAVPPYTGDRLTVLWSLALRMNADGTGYASTRQLAGDSRSGERTVERATADARRRGHLNRTQRGHRLGNGQAVANEWALISSESQPVTTDGLSVRLPVTTDGLRNLNPSEAPPQPVTTAGPRGLDTRGLSKTTSSAKPPRSDVEQICQHLADRMVANECKRPTITERWRDAARLLLDKDGRTVEQVIGAIDWATADPFWQANILSLPTLRAKYETLRLAAKRKRDQANGRASPDRDRAPATYHQRWQPED